MKKHSVWQRLLTGALAFLMLLTALPLSLISFAEGTRTPPESLSKLSDYYHNEQTTVTDTYVDIDGRRGSGYGNPVTLYYYYDKKETYAGSKVGENGAVTILYVMNTNTTRYGTDSDETIVRSMLERGFYVIVMDYEENPIASPDLDWSIQTIRSQILKGEIATPNRGVDASLDVALNYVVPAGYNITYGIPYFAYDLDGAAGSLELIVDIWNNDFKSVKRESIVYWYDDAAGVHKATAPYDPTDPKYYRAGEVDVAAGKLGKDYGVWFKTADGKDGITNAELLALLDAGDPEAKKYCYTYIGNTKAESITDCVKPDGSFIDLVLRMDVIYPTGNAGETPVMISFSSGYTRASACTSEMRPQLTGFLFSGYTGVISDYGLVPMSRNDHYGYFCGNSQDYSVSGDNYTYSLSVYNGIKSDTALLRTLRELGTEGITYTSTDPRESVLDGSKTLKYRIAVDKIGGYGNSKAGPIIRLGAEDPLLLEELRHLPGHLGESRYDLLLDPALCTYVEDGETVTYYTDPYYTMENGVATAKDARVRLPRAAVYPEQSSRLNLTYGQCGACADTVTEGHCPIFANGTQQRGGDGSSYYTFYHDVFMNARSNDLPFYGLISPKIGHSYGYGVDGAYGIDTYYAFHRFANYWLQNGNPSCEIIDVDTTNDIGVEADKTIDRIYEFDEGSAIRIQFIGVIARNEILEKVKIFDSVTGETVDGEWTSLFGGAQWKFLPYSLKDGTYYTVTVPKTLTAENGKTLKEAKSLTFRTESGVGITAEEASGNTTLTDGRSSYFIFEEADYEDSFETLLRFTVTEDRANTVEVYGAAMGEASSYEEITVWEKIGEKILVGAGTYSVDVTEFTKGKSGRLIFRLGAKRSAGKMTVHSFNFEGSTSTNINDHRSGLAVLTQYERSNITAGTFSVKDRTGGMMRFGGYLSRLSWIDLENRPSGNYADTMVYGFTMHYFQNEERTFDEKDYGRKFRISFDVYDETSRNIYLAFSKDMTTVDGVEYADFENSRRTFRTVAGEWKTYTIEQWVTDPSLYEIFTQRSLNFGIQNKTALLADEDVAVCPSDMADGTGTKASNYAGVKGLADGYTTYTTGQNSKSAMQNAIDDGKIHIRHKDETGTALYIGNILVEEITETVPLYGKASLSLHPTETKETLPVIGAAVSSSDPDTTLDSLVVGGGSSSEDGSKVYLQYDVSLLDSQVADVILQATGGGETVTVYGVSDLTDWTADSLTTRRAPAIDPLTGKVDLTKVYGGAPLTTFTADGTEKITLEIGAFATAMKELGATSVTLLLTSDKAASGKKLTTLLFDEKTFLSTDSFGKYIRSGGYGKSESVAGVAEVDGSRMLTFAPYGDGCTMRFGSIFFPDGTTYDNNAQNRAWTKDDVGKRIRVTFTVKRTDSLEGDVTLRYGMMRSCNVDGKTFRFKDADGNITTDDGNYGFGFYEESGAVEEGRITLKAGEYAKTVTYEFTVTDKMFAKDVYRIKDVNDPSLDTYEGSFAIAYFGINLTADSFPASDLTDVDNRPALAFGMFSAKELPDGTKVSPVLPKETALFTYVFNKDTVRSTYIRPSGFNMNYDHDVSRGDEKVVRDEDDNAITFAPFDKDCTFRTASIFFPEGTEYVISGVGSARNRAWTRDDVGRRIRVTFTVRRTDSIDQDVTLRYGMMRSFDLRAGRSYTAKNADGTAYTDPADYSFGFYTKSGLVETGEVVLKAGEAAKTVTYEFTVTEDMFAKEVFSGEASQGFFAISYLGFQLHTDYDKLYSTLNTDRDTLRKADNALSRPTVKFLGSMSACEIVEDRSLMPMSFDKATLPNADYNGIWFRAAGYAKAENVAFPNGDTDNDRTFAFAPFDEGCTIRNASIFFPVGTNYTYSTMNRAWTEDDVGKTLRVTFTVRRTDNLTQDITLRYGMMRGIGIYAGSSYTAKDEEGNAYTDPADYGFGFYTKAGKVGIGELVFKAGEAEKTVTYEFTVTEDMFAKEVFGASGESQGSFAIAYLGFQIRTDYNSIYKKLGGKDNDNTELRKADNLGHRPRVEFSALSAREVNYTSQDQTEAVAVSAEGIDRTNLVILGKDENARTGIKKSAFTFLLPGADATEVFLRLPVTRANGEKLLLYVLPNTTLPTPTTYENLPLVYGDPYAVITAGVDTRLDITALARTYAGKAVTFLLMIEEESEDVTLDTPILEVTMPATETFDPATFKVKGNITLYTDFLYHAYVPVISALTSLTLDGEALDLAILPTKVIDGTLYYVVTKPIAPKEGAESFTLKATILADGETKTATYNLSIPTYAAKIVDNNATYNDTTKTLMRDILSYISAAMTYFDTSTDEAQNTITKIIGENYNKDLTAADVGLNKTGTASDSGKALSKICLNLDATPSFVFYLEKGKESLADTFKFTSENGAPLTVTVKKETSGQKRTYLEVTTYAYAMGDLLTFTYTDEAGAQTGTYHLAAYYGGDTSDANLSPLLLRLAKYAKSASAYRESVLGKPEGN